MPLLLKQGILDRLKERGYTTYELRKKKLLSESTVQKIRNNQGLSWDNLETLCRLLDCNIGDIVEYQSEKSIPINTLIIKPDIDFGRSYQFGPRLLDDFPFGGNCELIIGESSIASYGYDLNDTLERQLPDVIACFNDALRKNSFQTLNDHEESQLRAYLNEYSQALKFKWKEVYEMEL